VRAIGALPKWRPPARAGILLLPLAEAVGVAAGWEEWGAMTPRGTDALSDSLRPQPALVRWFVGGSARLFRVMRYLFALQFIGGAGGFVVGAVRFDGSLAAAGGGQALLAGFVLAIGAMGEGTVEEVHGPDGDFVVRGGKRRVWRERRGFARMLALVRGTSDWAVVVRHREDDPFGVPVVVENAESELASMARAREISHQLRHSTLVEAEGTES
jgi:hypothetical protein